MSKDRTSYCILFPNYIRVWEDITRILWNGLLNPPSKVFLIYFGTYMKQHGKKCTALLKFQTHALLGHSIIHVIRVALEDTHMHTCLNKHACHLNVQFSLKLPFLLNSQTYGLVCRRNSAGQVTEHNMSDHACYHCVQGMKGRTIYRGPKLSRSHFLCHLTSC